MSGKVTKKVSVYLETYGCSANQSHSEVMLGLLRDKGCHITKNPEKADILILNTCIVKEPTEKRIMHRIKKLRENFPKKSMIIAGCMPVGEYRLLRSIEPYASFLGPKNSSKIFKCLKGTLEGKKVEYLEGRGVYCDSKYRLNPYINIVEISEGCLGNCSYCIVRKAKGRLKSYPLSDILRDIKKSLKSGCREIWLTSQDCGCYGSDKDNSLTKLLREVTKIRGDFRVRLGMSNPDHIKPVLSDLIDIYRDKRMYKFLHLPVQSGSDRVLRDMNRHYVTKDFREIVAVFRQKLPIVRIWTDVIVGFPGETEKDFKETIKLIKETKPDFVNVSKFGIRPGTGAERMEQVSRETINKRSRQISDLVDRICLERNKSWIGKECRVLVTERGLKKGQYRGRNQAYKPVIIKTEKDILGKFVTVKVTGARKTHLKGILVNLQD
ncbi:MAG: tRNA (N(6)-L-threonylcarbamoyladenosine(37)-C(2))-methylthiotransferase [archaeon]|nr:MAG: tRNA (N(6)-L-threonylcarbamoyladenosine(37)-C(2))-methylthiotransferase [archaeon]